MSDSRATRSGACDFMSETVTAPLVVSEDSALIAGHHVRECRPRQADLEKTVPLLFVHGGCHGAWCWRNWQRHLAALGWHSYAVTLPGHNADDPMPPDEFVKLTLHDFANAVEDVLRQIPGVPVLVGHSMGGVIAQIVVSRNPVLGLVLVASGKTDPDRPHYPQVPTNAPFVLTREHARTLLFHEISDTAFEETYSKLVPESPAAMNDYTVGGVVDASSVRCPVLVIAAEFDRDQSLAAAADAIAAYGATGIRVRGAGHDLLLEDGMEFVTNYLHCWLENLGLDRIEPF